MNHNVLDKSLIDELLSLPYNDMSEWLKREGYWVFESDDARHYFIDGLLNRESNVIRLCITRFDCDLGVEIISKMVPDDTMIFLMTQIGMLIGFQEGDTLRQHQHLIATMLSRISEYPMDDLDDVDMCNVLDAMIKSRLDEFYPELFKQLEPLRDLGKTYMRQKLNPNSQYHFWNDILREHT